MQTYLSKMMDKNKAKVERKQQEIVGRRTAGMQRIKWRGNRSLEYRRRIITILHHPHKLKHAHAHNHITVNTYHSCEAAEEKTH